VNRRVAAVAIGVGVALSVVAFYEVRRYFFTSASNTTLTAEEIRQNYLDHLPSSTVSLHSTTVAPSSSQHDSVPLAATTAPLPVSILPKPGVYRYDTIGTDSVDALNGQHHDYPAVTTMTVVPFGCGVMQRWDVLKERWAESQRCVSGRSISQPTFTTYDEFFGQAQTDAYQCAGDPRPVDASAGTSFAFDCVKSDATDSYSGVVIGTEPMSIGGVTVQALHVRISIAHETPRDTQLTDRWFQVGTDLMLAQRVLNDTTNPSVLGKVNYRERVEMHLISLEPQS
jgi:hypothetical protein